MSVTSATGKLDKSRVLIGWAVKLCREYLYALLKRGKKIDETDVFDAAEQHKIRKQEAADIGTLVHSWVEEYIKGKKPKMPTDERVKNGVLGFLKWIDEHKVKFIASEVIVYSKKHNYAGIVDSVAVVDREMCVVDTKTSSGFYTDMRYQTAGYQCAWEEMNPKGKKIDLRLIVRFTKEDNKNTGEKAGEFHVHRVEEYKKDLPAFLGLLAVAKREKELSKQ